MSFILQRSQKSIEPLKYDHVSYTYKNETFLSDFFEATTNKAITENEIGSDHPLFKEIFTSLKEPELTDKYIEYITREGDSFENLSTRLGIDIDILNSVNEINGGLYPDMIVKLPREIDIEKLRQPTNDTNEESLMKLKETEQFDSNSAIIKHKVKYISGPTGEIRGLLSIDNTHIEFEPFFGDQNNTNIHTIEELDKFRATIRLADVHRAESINIPQIEHFITKDQPDVTYVLQVLLYRVGNKEDHKHEKFKEFHFNQQAHASVSFSVEDEFGKNAEEICLELKQIINNRIIQLVSEETENEEQVQNIKETNVPFFDVISLKCIQSAKSIESRSSGFHIITRSAIFGVLSEKSDILTPEHFENLVKKFPLIYKLHNWHLEYSARRDGSAFSTFLKKSKDVCPSIFLVKEYKGNILGAFLVDSIEFGKTGRGEMFIFVFKGEEKVPEIYNWTTKNDFFVYLDNDQGIGIGMGIKYGIFVGRNLDKGSSAPTNTFGNKKLLSTKEDFDIDEVELWGVDNTF